MRKAISPTDAKIDAAIAQLKAALEEAIQNAHVSADRPLTHIRDLGQLLEQYRKAHGLSKGDVNLMAGVTPHTMRRFETDPTTMRVDTLLNVLEAFGMTLFAGPIDG